MFNSKLKKAAIKNLQKAAEGYNKQFNDTAHKMEELQKIREYSVKILNDLSQYISDLANSPIEYDTTIAQTTARCNHFNERVEQLKKESQEINLHAGSTAGAGALAGAGVAAAAPSLAISIAMTFGTASTGTAIASLSGAAAMNAALAWLGGGALAAGGAGMAGGTALLALANPVGLAIGALAILGGGWWASSKNKEIAEKAEKSTRAIKKEIERMKEIEVQVGVWKEETYELNTKIKTYHTMFEDRKMFNYNLFSEADKDMLRILINSAETLSKKIGETVQDTQK